MLIMCDVDSTLVDFQAIAHRVAQLQGVKWPLNCSWWIPPEQCGMSMHEFNEMFRTAHSREHFLDAEPYNGAVEALEVLSRKFTDLEVQYVSHRHEEDNDVLQEWLTRWGFPTPQNSVSSYSKSEWIKENNPVIVIDDRIRTMIVAKDAGVPFIYSLTHPWNCNLKNIEIPGIHLVDSWAEMYIKLKESLNFIRNMGEERWLRAKTR